MTRSYAVAVFIGRFQPFHLAHFDVATFGLSIADKLIFIIGSSFSARTTKNPFTFEERVRMIESSFPNEEDRKRLHFVKMRDYFNNDNHWLASIQEETRALIPEGASVALLGSYKDNSSYYLKYFPQWGLQPLPERMRSAPSMDATDIREALYELYSAEQSGRFIGKQGWVDTGVGHKLCDWKSWVSIGVINVIENCLGGTANAFRQIALIEEYEMLKEYKESWKSAPFPPTFVTTDAVVVCAGHVLLVRRKFAPGKGTLALPGGFLKQDERIEDGMIRELREETGIKVKPSTLRGCIHDSHVFDHPGRSLRGRTITHGYYIKLDGVVDPLPEVRGNDDADKAFWLPLMDVGRREEEFFEDHAHLIQYFANR